MTINLEGQPLDLNQLPDLNIVAQQDQLIVANELPMEERVMQINVNDAAQPAAMELVHQDQLMGEHFLELNDLLPFALQNLEVLGAQPEAPAASNVVIQPENSDVAIDAHLHEIDVEVQGPL